MPGSQPDTVFRAGAWVEVVDAASKHYRKTGNVKFFVADNVYVSLTSVCRLSTKMFYADQLRAVATPLPQRRFARIELLIRQAWLRLAQLKP